MPWLIASPCHQQPRNQICVINGLASSTRKHFDYMANKMFWNGRKYKYNLNPKMNSARNDFTLLLHWIAGYTGTMGFTETSANIHLEGIDLRASCKDEQGHIHDSRINLNGCIQHNHGMLQWQENGNFGNSSRSLSLMIEKVTTLHCQCSQGNGNWVAAFLELDEQIDNDNGKLVYVRPERK